MSADLETKLDRLTRLVGTDEGFYILALLAFVEYFLRYERRYGEGPSFPELTWSFREELLHDHGEGFIDGLYCLGRLGRQHALANRVRHAFERMDPEEAAAATHLFATFCRLAGIDGFRQVRLLEKSLAIWSTRSSVLESAALCILVPRKCEIEPLRRLLEQAGLELEAIREEQFSFRSTGKLRVSTLHSSKGLDFPVVLLYLPYLPWRQAYDDAQTERLLRNLLYVGLTRAMDNVNAFLLEGGEPGDPILRDLAGCFGR